MTPNDSLNSSTDITEKDILLMDITSPPSSDHEQPNLRKQEMQGLRNHTEILKNNMNIMNDMNANSFRNLMGGEGSGTNHLTSDIVLVEAGVGEPYEDVSEEEFGGNTGVDLGVNGFEPASMVKKVNIGEKIDYFEKFERERSVIRKEGGGAGDMDFELESRPF